MSDRRASRLVSLALAVLPALPVALPAALSLALTTAAAAQATCLPLGGRTALCPEGSAWVDAGPVPIPDEDGVTAYELPPLYLEASLDWVRPAQAATPEAALALLRAGLDADAAAEGDPAPALRLHERVAGTDPAVTMDVYDEYLDGRTYPLAVLLVPEGKDWLTLFLSSDSPMPQDDFLAAARGLAALLRPTGRE